jgi:hypothetical protein
MIWRALVKNSQYSPQIFGDQPVETRTNAQDMGGSWHSACHGTSSQLVKPPFAFSAFFCGNESLRDQNAFGATGLDRILPGRFLPRQSGRDAKERLDGTVATSRKESE